MAKGEIDSAFLPDSNELILPATTAKCCWSIRSRRLWGKRQSDQEKKRQGGENNQHGGAKIQSFMFLHQESPR
jgi:hypothetical protein